MDLEEDRTTGVATADAGIQNGKEDVVAIVAAGVQAEEEVVVAIAAIGLPSGEEDVAAIAAIGNLIEKVDAGEIAVADEAVAIEEETGEDVEEKVGKHLSATSVNFEEKYDG